MIAPARKMKPVSRGGASTRVDVGWMQFVKSELIVPSVGVQKISKGIPWLVVEVSQHTTIIFFK